MTLKVTWQQALAWRMRRQLLDSVGGLPVAGVVRRLCGVQAQVASSAELAVRVQRETSDPGEVGSALSDGTLIKTWAMRGALHLLTPEDGGAFLALMAAGRAWERPSWQRYFGVTPAQLDGLGGAVREALAASAPSSWPTTSTSWPRRNPRTLSGCCPASTSTSSVRAPGISTSYRPGGGPK